MIQDTSRKVEGPLIEMMTFIVLHFLTWCIQTSCIKLLYSNEPNLRSSAPLHAFDSFYGTASVYRPIGRSSTLLGTAKQCLNTWKIYFKSPILFASLSSCVLYATVLNGGIVTLGYMRWRHVPCIIIGLVIALQNLSMGSLRMAHWLHRRSQSLAKTASVLLWIIWTIVFLVAVLCFHVFEVKSSTWVLLLVMLVTLPSSISRVFGIIHSKLLKEWVEIEYIPMIS